MRNSSQFTLWKQRSEIELVWLKVEKKEAEKNGKEE